MKIEPGASRSAVFVLASALAFAHCGSVFKKSIQDVPVTSSPPGAAVFLDGRPVGTAPRVLRLSRHSNHRVRIEKAGYNPAVISIERKPARDKLPIILGDVALGVLAGGFFGMFAGWLLGGDDGLPDSASLGALVGAGAVSAITILDDSRSGRLDELSPGFVEVVLTRIETNSRPSFVRIDASKPSNVRWIRIRLTD